MKSKMIAATIAAAMLCVLPACSTVAEKSTPALQDAMLQPVEKVNGVAITRGELERTVKTLLVQNRMPQELPPEMLRQARELALSQLTSAELIYQEARKSEPKELDKLVAAKLEQGRARFGNETDFQKALKDEGMTLPQLKETLRREVVINTFIERRFGAKEAVSEAEAKKFYEENAEKYFKKGDRVKAHHILVAVDRKAAPEEKQKAREKAETLLKRVKGGEDFAALAKKESNCPTAPRGGDLGAFGKGQMPASFEKAVYSLKPGEIGPLVESEYGFHIVRLDEKLAPSTDSFEQVKEKIVAYLKAEKVKKAVSGYLDELRNKAKIDKV